MRKIMLISFASGLLAAALPAQATDTSGTRSEAAREQPQANGASAGERRICVREPRSESRIRRSVCHTAREWRDLQGGDTAD